jgi:isochorismatase family protein
MKPNVENESPETRNLSRREILGLIGATAAASLVGGAGQQSASAEQVSKSTQNPRRVARVEAKPEPIAVDIGQTAVIVVDMQNDFCSKGGLLDRAGLDFSMIQRAVGPTAKVLTSARQSALKIVYLKMGFRPDLSDLGVSDRTGCGTSGLASERRFGPPTVRKAEFLSGTLGTQTFFPTLSRSRTM